MRNPRIQDLLGISPLLVGATSISSGHDLVLTVTSSPKRSRWALSSTHHLRQLVVFVWHMRVACTQAAQPGGSLRGRRCLPFRPDRTGGWSTVMTQQWADQPPCCT